MSSSPVEVQSNASKRRRVTKAPTAAGYARGSVAVTAPGLVAPRQRAVASTAPPATDEGSFQAAVLERLRDMCGEHEDAKVLAEYIVVMAAGNKGPEEMTSELKPFFHEAEQAESFVEWVEECKWRFLTGEPASPKKATGGDGTDSPICHSPSPIRRMDSPDSEPVLLQHQAVAGGKPARPAAGASRPALPAVMAPPPHSRPKPLHSSPATNGSSVFEVGVVPVSTPAKATTSATLPNHGTALASVPAPVPARAPQAAVLSTSSSHASSAAGGGAPAFSKSVAAARTVGGPTTVRREKNELLKNMTKQLQVILTKLNDRNLNDSMRERYQAMAQSVQAQMAKLSRPQPAKRRV